MKIQLRRDTLAAWTTANPVLSPGEAGFEIDTGILRIGNGTDQFLSLPESINPDVSIGPVEISDVTGLPEALGDKVPTSDLSTTGGPNKVPKLGASGEFRTASINSSQAQSLPPIRISARQRIEFEDYAGNSVGNVWMFPDHSSPSGAGFYPEIVWSSSRHCFYWDEGFQFGNSASGGASRGRRYMYFNALGSAKAGTSVDVTMESIPIMHYGLAWNGSAQVSAAGSHQFIPSGSGTGEWAFFIGGSEVPGTASANGRMRNTSGHSEVFTLTNSGPKIPTGKVLTFPDGSTMSSASAGGGMRTGNAVLVSGAVAVADPSVTNKTNVILTRKAKAGTVGNLTYTTTPGTGFNINSDSATDTSVVTYLLIEGATATNAPTISGTNEIGDTLTAASGGGSGGWQWYVDGSPVSGATANTYVIRPADIGKTVTVREGGVASAGVVIWKPGDETGYAGDWQADQGTLQTVGGSPAAHGDPVGEWINQAGVLGSLINATPDARPTKNESLYAGYPFVDFDGIDDVLRDMGTKARPMTVFLVHEPKTLVTDATLVTTIPYGERLKMTHSSAGALLNRSASTAGGVAVIGTRMIGTARTNATENAIRANDGVEAISTTTTGNGDGLYLGAGYVTDPLSAASVRVFALLYYASDLSPAAQARVRKYLKAKWGTP